MKNILNIVVFSTLFISNSPLLMAQEAPKKAVAPSLKSSSKKVVKKNAEGFWVNEIDLALNDAAKSKKPLLIDFYGIWCPPCNQLDELVFPTTKFKAAAKKFVLLKLDADSEKSWVLKSKYKVAGYPTLLMIKVEDNQPAAEIDRIVGYYPTDMITAKMSEALISDGKTAHQRISDLIQKSLDAASVAGDSKDAAQLTEAGLVLQPDNIDLKLTQIEIKSSAKDYKISADDQAILTKALADRKNLSARALLKLAGIQPSKDVIDELISRVNPETYYIDNEGYTSADVYAMGIGLGEKEKNDTTRKMYLDLTVEAYENLLKKYGNDARSTNLSYTYYLEKAGQFTKAKNVYERMFAKYPNEFTFYYSAADFAVEQKDFSLAKIYIQKAIDNSYGDNRIRSYNKALKISMTTYNARKTEEERNSLKSTITEFEKVLADFKKPEGFEVRTDRYLKRMAESIEEAKKLL